MRAGAAALLRLRVLLACSVVLHVSGLVRVAGEDLEWRISLPSKTFETILDNALTAATYADVGLRSHPKHFCALGNIFNNCHVSF